MQTPDAINVIEAIIWVIVSEDVIPPPPISLWPVPQHFDQILQTQLTITTTTDIMDPLTQHFFTQKLMEMCHCTL